MSQLARGNLSGVTVVLGSLAFTALFTGFIAVGLRSLERDIPMLIQEINGVLDSAATFTSRAT